MIPMRLSIVLFLFIAASCSKVTYESFRDNLSSFGNGSDIPNSVIEQITDVDVSLNFTSLTLDSGKLILNYSSSHSVDLYGFKVLDGSVEYALTKVLGTTSKIELLPNSSLSLEVGKAYHLKFFIDGKEVAGKFTLTTPTSISHTKFSPGASDGLLVSDGVTNQWKNYFIKTDITYNIPADFSDLNTAFNFLRTKRIMSSATVTLKIADGVYNYTEKVDANHPDGRNILIEGNTISPSLVELSFSNNTTGIGVSGPYGINISGITIRGSNTNSGISVTKGANIVLESLMVTNFNIGIFIRESAARITDVDIDNSFYIGLDIRSLSSARLVNLNINGSSAKCLFAGLGAAVEVTGGSSFRNCTTNGTEAWVNSVIAHEGTGTSYSGNGSNKITSKNSYQN